MWGGILTRPAEKERVNNRRSWLGTRGPTSDGFYFNGKKIYQEKRERGQRTRTASYCCFNNSRAPSESISAVAEGP